MLFTRKVFTWTPFFYILWTLGLTASRTVPTKICIGTNLKSTAGVTLMVNGWYTYLKDYYTNCTHIVGNLQLVHLFVMSESEAQEKFAFLNEIVEVTGYVLIDDFSVGQLIIPKLQVIRGETLFQFNRDEEGYALVFGGINDNTIRSLLLPSLREVSSGLVGIHYYYPSNNLTYLDTIDISEIRGEQISSAPKKFPGICHSSCEGGCWGNSSTDCQKFSKIFCSAECKTSRCFGKSAAKCCHPFCAGGCTGPSASECFACKNVYFSGKCIESCPPEMYTLGPSCVAVCPDLFLIDEETKSCLAECPYSKHPKNRKCETVLPPEKLCRGPSDAWSYIYAENLKYFKNCTILNGDIRIDAVSWPDTATKSYNLTSSWTVSSVDPSQLEIFSSLREVTGCIWITANTSSFTNLPYFRNLEIIGQQKRSSSSYFFSINIWNSSLQSMNFRSLKVIRDGSVGILDNKDLCYVADINWLSFTGEDQTNFVSNNAPKSVCQERGQVCSDECSGGCWGNKRWDCQCSQYWLGNKCVLRCASVKGYVADGKKCIQSCPVEKYSADGVCTACDDRCARGCNGPTNIVGNSGCNSCYLGIVDRNNTLRCMGASENCPDGYYIRTVSPAETGLLQTIAGGPICSPCHENCARCTDFGNSTDVCQECKNFRRDDICDSKCAPGLYPNKTSQECEKCHEECNECIGSSSADCKICRNFRIYLDSLDKSPIRSFLCVPRCPPEHPFSVIEDGGTRFCSAAANPGHAFWNGTTLIWVLGGGAILIVLTCLISIPILIYKLRSVRSTALLQVTPLGFTKLQAINEHELRIDGVLGKGFFGTVYKGVWMPMEGVKIPVAVKVLQGSVGSKENVEFINEGIMMSCVHHPNLLSMVGLCMGSCNQLVTPRMPLGCLKTYMALHQNNIDSQAILTWSSQIAQGMEYLECRRLVHRDLAARNVLVRSPYQVKITDFGLSKFLDTNQAEYQAQMELLPMKWLAVECLQHNTFSHKSDVWAFGVTIWEILTFGTNPFQDIVVSGFVEMADILCGGRRLQKPEICSSDLYTVLDSTWMLDRQVRPSFGELVEKFIEMSNDPKRYVIIPNEKSRKLPDYTTQYERDSIRELASPQDNPEEFISHEDFLIQRGVSSSPPPDEYGSFF